MKIGCLGTGTFGQNHVRVLRADLPQLEIAAIFDTNEPNLNTTAQLAPSAKVCRSVDELLSAGIDAVIISTPGFLHADQTAQCLKAGKHVLVEKPVMTTRQGCREMLALAEKHPAQIVLVNHELRYADYFRKLKQIVASGELGEIQLVWCKSFRGPFLKKVNNWIQDARYSGGSLLDMNSHHFDLMNWWVESKPTRVAGFGGNDVVRVVNNAHEVLDHASVSFEYESGVRGSLVMGMFAPRMGDDLEMGVMGSNGAVQTKMSRWEIHQWKRGNETADPIVHHLPPVRDTRGAPVGFVEVHEAFLQSVQRNERPLTDVRACVDASLLAIAAEEAIRTGMVVQV
ncbi:MAG TPA: Gfo/Idh/MocA family oxidoreductase [Tepidisphaeraceae bacterium]|jgi:predicted dehydrogenase|nr:Gfo/Idh/MocA family oxidoreductase [Tepidisphaeraceae bacterium]